ncbi:glycosyltransferase family protein [Chitinophaga vietnamensis]|uniref:hypothetical protein n=1 Tax=Chitinophaga vietnamensis TaxID=2593957 RepID=UPI00117806E3|nr:hypothetical protein [Chitinophaga vietnamensis]
MKRFALNFICKNESHIIERMLTSALPLTDLIVALDTGSTDDTIEVIQNFGIRHNIPTYVFERPFDDFGSSRNYALEMLKETTNAAGWDLEQSWGFWIDCDEQIEISASFKRDQINQDIYYVSTVSEDINFTKQLFFRLSKPFYWKGVVHEYIAHNDPTIQEAIIYNIQVIYEKKGASWQGDLTQKFLNYAEKLKTFIDQGNPEYRWIYYVGQSYSAAAMHSTSNQQKMDLLLLARETYQKALNIDNLERDEKYKLKERIADNKIRCGERWSDIQQDLLKAHAIDRRRGEPFCPIIEHYIEKQTWQTAYLYSSFAYKNYHQKKPKDVDISELRASVYEWQLLFYHYSACLHSGRISEARPLQIELKQLIQNSPQSFTEEAVQHIKPHLSKI